MYIYTYTCIYLLQECMKLKVYNMLLKKESTLTIIYHDDNNYLF